MCNIRWLSSVDGLLPVQHQAIIWTNCQSNPASIKFICKQKVVARITHLKMPAANKVTFCLTLKVLILNLKIFDVPLPLKHGICNVHFLPESPYRIVLQQDLTAPSGIHATLYYSPITPKSCVHCIWWKFSVMAKFPLLNFQGNFSQKPLSLPKRLLFTSNLFCISILLRRYLAENCSFRGKL